LQSGLLGSERAFHIYIQCRFRSRAWKFYASRTWQLNEDIILQVVSYHQVIRAVHWQNNHWVSQLGPIGYVGYLIDNRGAHFTVARDNTFYSSDADASHQEKEESRRTFVFKLCHLI
jgi:hypothetical protein